MYVLLYTLFHSWSSCLFGHYLCILPRWRAPRAECAPDGTGRNIRKILGTGLCRSSESAMEDFIQCTKDPNFLVLLLFLSLALDNERIPTQSSLFKQRLSTDACSCFGKGVVQATDHQCQVWRHGEGRHGCYNTMGSDDNDVLIVIVWRVSQSEILYGKCQVFTSDCDCFVRRLMVKWWQRRAEKGKAPLWPPCFER